MNKLPKYQWFEKYVWDTAYNEGVFAALLTDLSKAFNCISHELLIEC